jgi:hypothetical protein
MFSKACFLAWQGGALLSRRMLPGALGPISKVVDKGRSTPHSDRGAPWLGTCAALGIGTGCYASMGAMVRNIRKIGYGLYLNLA